MALTRARGCGTLRAMSTQQKPLLKVLLAAPRGFCAGVDRAVNIVEQALTLYGAPVYVRHEIVHNKHVTQILEAKGAVFVEELDAVPANATVIFSAHGVPTVVPAEAARRQLRYIDATCPLVTKVHVDVRRHAEAGRSIVLIGHAGHPEVIGTMGQLPAGQVHLIETTHDAENFTPPNNQPLAYVTQTTLSVDDTAQIIATLQRRFPHIAGPIKEDICYATSNRQGAVKLLVAQGATHVLVIGAPNSSNSVRLLEVAQRAGALGQLIGRADEINLPALQMHSVIGLTAGASAPEVLVQQMLDYLDMYFAVQVQEVQLREERVRFNLPRFPQAEA